MGGKNASFGEMYKALAQQNVLVPDGFAVTADACRFFLAYADIGAALDLEKVVSDKLKLIEEPKL